MDATKTKLTELFKASQYYVEAKKYFVFEFFRAFCLGFENKNFETKMK